MNTSDPLLWWDNTYIVGWSDAGHQEEPDEDELATDYAEAYMAGWYDRKESDR